MEKTWGASYRAKNTKKGWRIKIEWNGWTKRVYVDGKINRLPEMMEKCTRCALDPVHLAEVLEDFEIRVIGTDR